MLANLAAGLVPCPLCDRRVARAHGACPDCADGLASRASRAREDDVDVAWLSPYDGPGLRAVRAVKFGARLTLAHALGRALGEHVAAGGWPVARVVPVPLHPRRRLRRGYDQADRLARGVAAALDAPLSRPLARVRATSRQARAGAGSRDGNVAGAFRSVRLPPVPLLLVDDVWTTGATARACRAALVAAGAREVRVAVVARAGAPPPQSQSARAVAIPRMPPTTTCG